MSKPKGRDKAPPPADPPHPDVLCNEGAETPYRTREEAPAAEGPANVEATPEELKRMGLKGLPSCGGLEQFRWERPDEPTAIEDPPRVTRLTFDLKPLANKLDELAAKGIGIKSIRFVPKKPN